jgi:hypothetical protein
MKSRIFVVCSVALLVLAMLSEASAAPRRAVADPNAAMEARTIQQLGKGVAKALASTAFRARIAEELSKSPYVEGRIPLKRLMASDAEVRGELLRQSAFGLRWGKVAGRLPELELYFPFRIHRETWSGEAEIQVAVASEISGTHRIFATNGSTWTVPEPNRPAVPTLLMGPSEIDYDDKESALAGGVRTGAYLRDLALFAEWLHGGKNASSPLRSVTAESSDPSHHTYLTYFYIPDWEDSGWAGNMEIDVFGSVDGGYSACEPFTDIEAEVHYYLAAPGASGDRKIAHAVPTSTTTVDVLVYEDDDTQCVVKMGGINGDDYLGVANLQISHFGTIYGTSNAKASVRVETQNTTCGDSSCGGDENASNCCSDCASCGNGQCNTPCESNATCRTDCPLCGDGLCGGGESSSSCCQDCGAYCGNGVCQTECGESEWSCPGDCSIGGNCGNGICDVFQGECASTCPQDCVNGEFCQ